MRELMGALARGVAPTGRLCRRTSSVSAHEPWAVDPAAARPASEPAGRLARAVSILECGDLQQAAELAQLDEDEAAAAADVLAGAEILEPGRPLAFCHPIVRAGIYAELASGDRARGHRAAARLLAPSPGSNERVAEHLLLSDPAADEWVVERLVQAARSAARSGAPESAAVYLRRVLEEPPARGDGPGPLAGAGYGRGQRRAARMAGSSGGCARRRHRRLGSRRGGDGAGARAGPRSRVGGRGRRARPRRVAARPRRARARCTAGGGHGGCRDHRRGDGSRDGPASRGAARAGGGRLCGAARAARRRGVRVGDHQPAGGRSGGARRTGAGGGPGRAQWRDRPALVRTRHVVLPDHGLAPVGRAL